jgi:hypothetical protein
MPPRNRGSVLVVVMWITFGLISITLYFANSMTFELRASDNRVAGEEAEFAIDAGRRYVTCILSNLNQSGAVPDPTSYVCSAVPVGNAKFWIIGRTNVENTGNYSNLVCGLIPESSKVNLNAFPGGLNSGTNLALLPRMNLNLAYNIMAWESTNTANSVGGAESDTYMMQSPPYLCKNAPFETLDELRLVYQMNVDILYGEDANLNGILDPNENDGDLLPPSDNSDGRLDPGIFEYLTVYSAEPANDTNGNPRVDVSAANAATQLTALLSTNFDASRAQEIEAAAGLLPGGGGGGGGRGPGGGPVVTTVTTTFTSPLQFYIQSGMTPAEFAQIEPSLRGPNLKGLINIDTAGSVVLQFLPGMDTNTAAQFVASRTSLLADPNNQNTVAWVTQVLTPQQAVQIGPWITARSYQFTADIAAVGHEGRGYRRTRFVFDTSTGTPVIVYRQDLTDLGWALGAQARAQLVASK